MKYKTLKDNCESKFTEKSSKFLGFAYAVKSPEEAESILTACRKKFYDATHHCYAWQTGNGHGTQFRYSDDGEPSGTAGLPIYQQIGRHELTDVLLISVRYFGGTKLGTGGLIRAYGQSASDTLDAGKIITVEEGDTLQFMCNYHLHPVVLRTLNGFHLIRLDQDFAEDVTLTVEVDETQTDTILKTVLNTSKGDVQGVILRELPK